MKKRLLALTLSLLCVLLLTAPVVAMSLQADVSGSCLCSRDRQITFFNTDTREYCNLCPNCGRFTHFAPEALVHLSSIPLSKDVIFTSESIQRACNHSFAAWYYVNCSTHSRICKLCSYPQSAAHQIVPPTCEDAAYCRDCEETCDDWPNAAPLDHIWSETRYDWEHNLETGEHYHHQICERTNDYGNSICDGERYRVACVMRVRWDEAVNGYHEVYDQCDYCYMIGEDIVLETCSAPLFCYRCANDPPVFPPVD